MKWKSAESAVNRRAYLKSAALTGALTMGGQMQGATAVTQDRRHADQATSSPAEDKMLHDQGLTTYSRYRPSFGGPVNGPSFLGKLVPGLRKSGLPPVPVTTVDGSDLPWKMVNGVKEYDLIVEPVVREFLPGNPMHLWGYNGSMPGPTIQAFQGDRVRINVHNRLPEVTTVHWHGLELPNRYDGIPGVTQPPIKPGETFVYEFDLHQSGTFFYHPHTTMPEAFGMVGFFIIHPKIAYDPPVDRDFVLVFQNFHIPPNGNIPDSWSMDWNWQTINGRSGPFTTPLVCKHGERVRIRIMDFAPIQHHPVHLHGHTFWITGHEGNRLPESAWVARNNALIGVAQATDMEFIAFNPGDWMFHCHMVHHMMNHMVKQVGPRIRHSGPSVEDFMASPENRPRVQLASDDPRFRVPGYPQMMQNMYMSKDAMMRIHNRREVRGMRAEWASGVKGLMTVVRVLPEDLFTKVMHTNEPVPVGASVPGSVNPPSEMMMDMKMDEE